LVGFLSSCRTAEVVKACAAVDQDDARGLGEGRERREEGEGRKGVRRREERREGRRRNDM
jgi:hypothetical protein